MSRVLGCVLLASLGAGCAAHRPADVRPSSAVLDCPDAASSDKCPSSAVTPATAKVRPLFRSTSEAVEDTDQELMAALRGASTQPTAQSERRVADAYRKAGILDQSYEHLNRALHLDPRDGRAYEERARIWRDWGFPEHGLGDAYRAIYFLHDAPETLNTLGTLLYALGQRSEARKCFESALRQSPDAVYALDNLCYTALMDGDLDGARTACRRAVEIQPHSMAARNNLALLHMAEGDVTGAAREFAESNNPAALHYNLGLVYLAAKRYAEAAAAFETAVRLNPTLPFVNERLRQARSLAGGTDARH
jgi:tetratricopeptide (TPR) repeat protein